MFRLAETPEEFRLLDEALNEYEDGEKCMILIHDFCGEPVDMDDSYSCGCCGALNFHRKEEQNAAKV